MRRGSGVGGCFRSLASSPGLKGRLCSREELQLQSLKCKKTSDLFVRLLKVHVSVQFHFATPGGRLYTFMYLFIHAGMYLRVTHLHVRVLISQCAEAHIPGINALACVCV